MNTKKLYVFDIDGTLTDSVKMYHEAVIKALNTIGIQEIDTNFNNYKHHTDRYALRYNYERNFNESMPLEKIDAFESALIASIDCTRMKPILGAKELLDQLRAQKTPFCFATGSLPNPALLKLSECDLWYDKALLATSKTHEDREGFVLEAIDKAKKYYRIDTFDKIVSIGNGVWDLLTAKNLNIDFIGIGEKNYKSLTTLGMEQWYPDLKSLLKSVEFNY
ncbi:HAD family hydrolase [Aquimarina rhabdastrellae]